MCGVPSAGPHVFSGESRVCGCTDGRAAVAPTFSAFYSCAAERIRYHRRLHSPTTAPQNRQAAHRRACCCLAHTPGPAGRAGRREVGVPRIRRECSPRRPRKYCASTRTITKMRTNRSLTFLSWEAVERFSQYRFDRCRKIRGKQKVLPDFCSIYLPLPKKQPNKNPHGTERNCRKSLGGSTSLCKLPCAVWRTSHL